MGISINLVSLLDYLLKRKFKSKEKVADYFHYQASKRDMTTPLRLHAYPTLDRQKMKNSIPHPINPPWKNALNGLLDSGGAKDLIIYLLSNVKIIKFTVTNISQVTQHNSNPAKTHHNKQVTVLYIEPRGLFQFDIFF